MVDYFETANRQEEYEKLSDYKKGYIDGIFTIGNNIDEELKPLMADAMAEYIDEYLENVKHNPPEECDSLEKCAEIFTHDFLMYNEKMTMDVIKTYYILTIANFLAIKLPDDPEMVDQSEAYKTLEEKFASGLQFYFNTRVRLYDVLDDYKRGFLDAYTAILSTLDMNIRTDLRSDDCVAVEGVRLEILDVLKGNVNIPIQPGTPVFLPVLEAVYPIFMANDLMECCMEHIVDKFMDEYTYYISEFTGIDYDEVFDTVMNE